MPELYNLLIPFPDFNLVKISDLCRFWAKIKVADSGCMIWTGCLYNGTYGRFKLLGEDYCSHRVAYYFETRIDPGKILVLHKCNVKQCCNYNHLYLDTQSQNMKQAYKDRLCSQSGESNSNAKLNEIVVKKIIQLSYSTTIAQIAKKLNINSRTVGHIVNGDRWTHIKRF